MNCTGISSMKPVFLVYSEVSTCVYEKYVIMKTQKYKMLLEVLYKKAKFTARIIREPLNF
jgi:hypothetical protein